MISNFTDNSSHAAELAQRMANRKLAKEGRTVVFRIKRCDGPGKAS